MSALFNREVEAGKFAEVLNGAAVSRARGFFCGVEVPEELKFPEAVDVRHPAVFLPARKADTSEPACVGPVGLTVDVILTVRNEAQIANSVVSPVSILMVNDSAGFTSVHEPPSEVASKVFAAAKLNHSVAVVADNASIVSRRYSVCALRPGGPCKPASGRIVGQIFANIGRDTHWRDYNKALHGRLGGDPQGMLCP